MNFLYVITVSALYDYTLVFLSVIFLTPFALSSGQPSEKIEPYEKC